MKSNDLIFDAESHIYLTDEAVEVPSVTTILNYVTAAHYGAINPSVLERAKMRGTAVHEATELIDYGGEADVGSEITGYITAYLDFLNDWRPKWEGIEKVCFSPSEWYCGTVDRHGEINGKEAVLDIKTTSSPSREAYISVCAQTAAYAKALGMPDADRYALYLKSDGNYRVVDCKKHEQKHGFSGAEIFSDCLALYNKLKGIK